MGHPNPHLVTTSPAVFSASCTAFPTIFATPPPLLTHTHTLPGFVVPLLDTLDREAAGLNRLASVARGQLLVALRADRPGVEDLLPAGAAGGEHDCAWLQRIVTLYHRIPQVGAGLGYVGGPGGLTVAVNEGGCRRRYDAPHKDALSLLLPVPVSAALVHSPLAPSLAAPQPSAPYSPAPLRAHCASIPCSFRLFLLSPWA